MAKLRAARASLERRGVAVTGASSVYETAPQGEVLDQPDFLNACLRVETDLDPEALLDRVQGGGARARPRVPAGPATDRGPWTWTCSCSARSSTAPSGSCSRTRRSPRGASCSSRCSSWTPSCALPDGTPLATLLAKVADQRGQPRSTRCRSRPPSRGVFSCISFTSAGIPPPCVTWIRPSSWRASAATTIPASSRRRSPAARACRATSSGRCWWTTSRARSSAAAASCDYRRMVSLTSEQTLRLSLQPLIPCVTPVTPL